MVVERMLASTAVNGNALVARRTIALRRLTVQVTARGGCFGRHCASVRQSINIDRSSSSRIASSSGSDLETEEGRQPTSSGSSVGDTEHGDNGGGGRGGNDGNGSGGGGGDEGQEGDDDELYSLEEAERIAAARGVDLPSDFADCARAGGLRASALTRYLTLQGGLLAGLLARNSAWFRDRLIADHRFLFKVMAEVLIDSGCATVAEVRKRGDEFWQEFEFYISDLLVGIVMDVVLVGLMAPVAVIGKAPKAAAAKETLLIEGLREVAADGDQ